MYLTNFVTYVKYTLHPLQYVNTRIVNIYKPRNKFNSREENLMP